MRPERRPRGRDGRGQSSALPLLSLGGSQGRTVRGIVTDPVGPVEDAQPAVQMFTYDHPTAREGASPGSLLNLQTTVGPVHRVVAIDHALLLEREHLVEVPPSHPHKSRTGLGRPSHKLVIKLLDITHFQKGIGLLDASDAAQAQLLRHAPLPSPEVPFPPPSRLGRVRGNHLNPQLLQGASHLRQTLVIDRFTSFGSEEEMAGSVAVEGAEAAFL